MQKVYHPKLYAFKITVLVVYLWQFSGARVIASMFGFGEEGLDQNKLEIIWYVFLIYKISAPGSIT